ncbi:transcription initiation factor IIE subunit beta [Coprinopsis cinerea okayama7|uniref:Transcription initiation factor IIE subunit beta n=1 Tax=Coprinopsis cinerea (strain Okayama-7 / 130 / ATCC MYA-4618 / FGSC 9003) TaxID=240176 RepID=A8NID0_COPC7|nr:transcription initiation factor IIE subunit beta [Coprinopsis cinerea okayama7\|eukprot:XP_001833970.1 transcription initiation factor IIE subunit beta [Coprinopsis cinerea okayama7\
MSKLQQDAAAFKSVMHRQDLVSWRRGTQAASTSTATTSTTDGGGDSQSSPPAKKKRPKTNVVYSQPADTGTGTNVNTQLVYAVSYLKNHNGPIRLDDLAAYTSTPVNTDPVLLEKFKAHDRVVYDPKTDLYSYKSDFTFRNKASLLTEIQRQTRKGGGLSVRALKDSWKEAPAAIEELEQEGDVLVTRTTKDGQLRMVFWNEIKPTDEAGGKRVDQEFLDLWHELKVPNEVDLQKELASEGLQVTAAEAPAPKPPVTKKKGKRGGAPRQRQAKITNTHLRGEIDLSKDYAPPGK